MSAQPIVSGRHARTTHEPTAHHLGTASDARLRGSHRDSRELTTSAYERAVLPAYRWYPALKGVADAVFGTILFLLTGPVMLVAAVVVKLTSRGPAFYRQARLGKDGRPFTIVKLRTMVDNAEAKTGAVWAVENDPRITRVGRVLRATHIDEFPQLVNVILGQMSLVGPRPERPEFVAKLEWEIPFYRERLRVRPGITGLAQVSLPPDTDIESVRRKLVHDLYYVRRLNPWMDVLLILETGWQLVRSMLRLAIGWVSLPSDLAIEREFSKVVGANESAEA